jgi:hypothetical protein
MLSLVLTDWAASTAAELSVFQVENTPMVVPAKAVPEAERRLAAARQTFVGQLLQIAGP